MSDEQEACPVCKSSTTWKNKGGSWSIDCPRCGKFDIGRVAANSLEGFSAAQIINLSGWIREHQGVLIVDRDFPLLKSLRPLTVGEKAEKILLQLARRFPKPGERLDLSGKSYLEFIGVGRLSDIDELRFIMRDLLSEEMRFLLFHDLETTLSVDTTYRISPKGWAYLDSLGRGNPQSQVGFIAMWFDDSVKDAWIAMENGIRDAGYRPFRVDQKEHNNDITDEIIAGIRGSKFLVADLTRHRNGVYFEAGFARGLGLQVVWLCRKSDEKDRHFDIRQLNCIFWEEDKLSDLTKSLANRIVATIGRGPLTANS